MTLPDPARPSSPIALLILKSVIICTSKLDIWPMFTNDFRGFRKLSHPQKGYDLMEDDLLSLQIAVKVSESSNRFVFDGYKRVEYQIHVIHRR